MQQRQHSIHYIFYIVTSDNVYENISVSEHLCVKYNIGCQFSPPIAATWVQVGVLPYLSLFFYYPTITTIQRSCNVRNLFDKMFVCGCPNLRAVQPSLIIQHQSPLLSSFPTRFFNQIFSKRFNLCQLPYLSDKIILYSIFSCFLKAGNMEIFDLSTKKRLLHMHKNNHAHN